MKISICLRNFFPLRCSASGGTVVAAVAALRRWSALGMALGWAAGLGAQTLLPEGFSETEVVAPGGLNRPVAMEFAPDGRLFVCEQGGRVRVVKNGVLLAQPFVVVPAELRGERGLLGIAFDPGFPANGWVYLFHTVPTPQPHSCISRVTAAGDVAVAGSEVAIFDLPPLGSSANHNGGAIHVDVAGQLFVAVGDNGVSANAQSLGSLNGKLLRLNLDGSIPASNPFYATTTGQSQAIWALGLRNPFTFTFGRSSGRMFINDVGEGRWEEINAGAAGANYGWPTRYGPGEASGLVAPIYAYPHPSSGSMAITGGAFYEPAVASFPAEFSGRYFFLDGGQQWIRVLDPATGAVTEFAPRLGAATGEMPLGLALGADGALYYAKNRTGSLLRIQYNGRSAPSIGTQPHDQLVTEGQTAEFAVTAYGAAPLLYQWEWDVNGDGSFDGVSGGNGPVLRLSGVTTAQDNLRLRCRVRNDFGEAVSAVATLRVTKNQPPVAVLDTPAAGLTYRAQQTIGFSGHATDPENGNLPTSALTWWVDFHHSDHVHPFLAPFSGSGGGSFVVPQTGEVSANVWFRIHLAAVDGGGLRHEVTRDVLPQKSTVTLATQPTGLRLTLDGSPLTAPYSFVGVVGMLRGVGAATQTNGGVAYDYASWSDGGAATHNLTTPSVNTTLTASFVSRGTARDASAFASQTVSAHMVPGQTNFVTLAFTNTGTTVWTDAASYKLGSVNPVGNTIWGVNTVRLPGPVNPGQVATIRFPVRAPTTVGTYNFRWQMLREGVGLIGVPSPNLRIAVASVQRNSRFVSQTVPATMTPGGSYRVKVQFANTGWQTWREADRVRLGVQMPADNLNWGLRRVVLATDVPTGAVATFEFNVRAPTTAGSYAFSWQMLQEAVAMIGTRSPVVYVEVR